MKTVTASANRELDEILDLIGVVLQLTPTQFEKAETSYLAVADWLSAPDSEVSPYNPEIFAQGSLRVDTTVKPLHHTEYDLDLVCLVQIPARTKPAAVYDLILGRMRENATYDKMIIEKPRCIRLDYSGDFHLDIVPAIPDAECAVGETYMKVPDRPLKRWRDSNPKGYSSWFEIQTAKRKQTKEAASLSANAGVEPLREPAPAHLKEPLRLSVQLLKRWRDLAFEGREDLAPSSIVLTTLAGELYDGETHPTDALVTILDRICAWARREQIVLMNPSNPKECITDRWKEDPDAYDAFIDAVVSFRAALRKLVEGGRYPDLIDDLRRLFGGWPVERAAAKFAELRKSASKNGSLRMDRSSGILSIAGAFAPSTSVVKVKGHTFHGE